MASLCIGKVFFALPALAIEVAEECSGIRSSLALLITGLLAGHMLLRTPWTRTALMAAIVPIAIMKNAVRIVVLTLRSTYVDRGFITSSEGSPCSFERSW